VLTLLEGSPGMFGYLPSVDHACHVGGIGGLEISNVPSKVIRLIRLIVVLVRLVWGAIVIDILGKGC
jgi:hypothetical protein